MQGFCNYKDSLITQTTYLQSKNVNIKAISLLVIFFLDLVISQHYSQLFVCVCVYRYLLPYVYSKLLSKQSF